MPIVPGSLKMSTKKKGGRADVEKLLQHTEFHPQGRIQLDPATGLVRNPRNNVLFIKKVKVKIEGKVVDEKDVPVNGGHVRFDGYDGKGSVWRIALKGPSKYHWKVMQDDQKFRFTGRMDRSAPMLEKAEMEEYQYFRVFLKETNTIVEEGKYAETDQAFYAWLKKQDKSKIQLLPLSVATVS